MALLTVNTDAEYTLFNPTQQIHAALAISGTDYSIGILASQVTNPASFALRM